MRLKDKVILITGSYTGIGKAIAQSCVKEGAKVILNGLDDAAGKELFAELGPNNSVMLTVDITESDTVEKLVHLAVKTFGKLDAVVNNAATIVSSNIRTTSPDFLRKVLDINLVAGLVLIEKSLDQLIENKGNVLNIGSINAWGGEPDLLAYSISKGGLMTMTRNLGDSLFREYGVRVNQINPGWVLTDNEKQIKAGQGMKSDWYRDLPDIFAPAKRLFAPEEIAVGAVFLLSDECGPVSAQVIDLEQFPMIGRNLPKSWEGSHK